MADSWPLGVWAMPGELRCAFYNSRKAQVDSGVLKIPRVELEGLDWGRAVDPTEGLGSGVGVSIMQAG